MLETIAKAISTALFFLCTAIVTGLAPSAPASTVPVSEAIVEETKTFSIVGQWQSGKQILEFTDSGKLIIGKSTLRYVQNGNKVTVTGEGREYTAELSPISERVMSFNGITMYKIK